MAPIRPFLFTLFLIATPAWGDARIQKSVVYSDAKEAGIETSLDVYAPPSGDDLPIVCWIHGGAWQIGNKERVELKRRALNDKGFVLISINYRLHPNTDYKGQASDVARAIHWIKEHAKEFGGSPERMFLMGHSAGAHLAALVSTDERYLNEEGMSLKDLRGTILLDGAGYDIPRQIELAALPHIKQMYESVFTKDFKIQRDASPIFHVEKGKQIPPFLILHIARRRDGRLQSEALGRAINETGGSAKVISEPNKSHATINRGLGEPDDVPTQHVFEFLEKCLQPNSPSVTK